MNKLPMLKKFHEQETRKFVLSKSNAEIIEELAKNTEGEFLQVRKPQKRIL